MLTWRFWKGQNLFTHFQIKKHPLRGDDIKKIQETRNEMAQFAAKQIEERRYALHCYNDRSWVQLNRQFR